MNIKDLWDLFEKQGKKCNLTDLPIGLFVDDNTNRTASLDRIDNTKGYIKGNVQWIHKDINYMKRILSQSQLIEYCRLIVNKDNRGA